MRSNLFLIAFLLFSVSYADEDAICRRTIEPKYPAKHKHYVKVELVVKDNPDPMGDRMLKVTFDGTNIPLRPADQQGNRGTTHLQVLSGKHTIVWEVQNRQYSWPKVIIYKKEIELEPNRIQAHIEIEDDNVRIS